MLRGEEHTRQFSRRYPGLFIILLDQSGSMSQPVEGKNFTKAQFATWTLNSIIYEMIEASGTDERGNRPLHAYLSVFGYNYTVYSLLSSSPHPSRSIDIISLPSLANSPKGYARVVRSTPSNANGQEYRPYWIKEDTQGRTEMKMAFEWAKAAAEHWFTMNPEPNQAPRHKCFPPIIINITDGDDNGDEGTIDVVRQIQNIQTEEGEPLIFNCHITSQHVQPCAFPVTTRELQNRDACAERLFEMSSIIPEPLRDMASQMGFSVPSGARCFVYNASPDFLVRFLRWGTVVKATPAGR